MLSISSIMRTNVERAKRWHKGSDWSVLEWSAAMNGESGEAVGALADLFYNATRFSQHSGEAANAAKKLKRIDDDISNINDEAMGRSLTDRKTACEFVAREIADVFMYGVILADRVGLTPKEFEDVLIEVFNAKSREYGFPERLSHDC